MGDVPKDILKKYITSKIEESYPEVMIIDRIQNMTDNEIENNYDEILRDTYVEWFDDQKFTPPEDNILEDTLKEDMSLYFLITLVDIYSNEGDQVFKHIVDWITYYEILKENDDLQSQYYHQITLDMHEFLRELEGQYDTDKMITHDSSYIEPAHAFLSFLLSQKNDENDIYGWEFAKKFNDKYVAVEFDQSQQTQEQEPADQGETYEKTVRDKFSEFQTLNQQTYKAIMDLKLLTLKEDSGVAVDSAHDAGLLTPERLKSDEKPVTPGTALQRTGTVTADKRKDGSIMEDGSIMVDVKVGELDGASSSIMPTGFKAISSTTKRPPPAGASGGSEAKMLRVATPTEGGKKKKKKKRKTKKRKTKKKRKKRKRTKRRIRKKKTKKRRKRRKRTRRKGRKRR
mgnify:CR=1 FL=1